MIENNVLLEAGLSLMKKNGRPLTKIAGTGRAMKYRMPNGETVRVRTCNDHILIVLSDKPSGAHTKLNIDGTDWLLIVMPEVQRTPGKVRAYLVPTPIAAEAARRTHQEWLDSNPNTKGDNRTWNLWFRDDGKNENFDETWSEYRLKGEATTEAIGTVGSSTDEPLNVKIEVESARQRISRAAGVSPEAVRITIDFAA
jgi:hypothetical protein